MKPVSNRFHLDFPVNLQKEAAGVVARVESLRGRISAFEPRESARGVEELFESLLAQTMDNGR
jgi:hypothetical protein